MPSPLLDPPCPGWQSDLPGPDMLPNETPSLGFNSPNHVGSVYLEVPRRLFLVTGIMVWFSLLVSMSVIGMSMLTAKLWKFLGGPELAVGLFCMTIGVWASLIFFRLDVSPPRDLPIRVNRTRQKLYAYNFKYSWWNPFGWRVMPVAYDWSQIRAEKWKQRGVTAQGVLIIKWGVTLSVVAPGTNKVIDRFPLSTMGADEHAWAYLCTYMQQGPQALPPPGLPRDPNQVPWYNLARLLAPKVKWPPDMDLESRSAP